MKISELDGEGEEAKQNTQKLHKARQVLAGEESEKIELFSFTPKNKVELATFSLCVLCEFENVSCCTFQQHNKA